MGKLAREVMSLPVSCSSFFFLAHDALTFSVQSKTAPSYYGSAPMQTDEGVGDALSCYASAPDLLPLRGSHMHMRMDMCMLLICQVPPPPGLAKRMPCSDNVTHKGAL